MGTEKMALFQLHLLCSVSSPFKFLSPFYRSHFFEQKEQRSEGREGALRDLRPSVKIWGAEQEGTEGTEGTAFSNSSPLPLFSPVQIPKSILPPPFFEQKGAKEAKGGKALPPFAIFAAFCKNSRG